MTKRSKVSGLSTRHQTSWLAMLTLFIAAISPLCQAQDARLAELNQRYPWGGLYVTGGALHNIHGISLVPERDAKNMSLPTGQGYDLFKGFIKTIAGKRQAARDIAMVHLDLRSLEAGYITTTGNTGTLTRIPWTSSEVVDAAEWYDRYLRSHEIFSSRIIDATGGLEGRWKALQEASQDAFTSATQFARYAGHLREWMADNPEGVEELRLNDQQLYSKVQEFQAQYDGSIQSPSSYPELQYLPLDRSTMLPPEFTLEGPRGELLLIPRELMVGDLVDLEQIEQLRGAILQ